MVTGTPCSVPSSSPAAWAGLAACRRATWAAITSSDEARPDRIAAAVSTADHFQMSDAGMAFPLARAGSASGPALVQPIDHCGDPQLEVGVGGRRGAAAGLFGQGEAHGEAGQHHEAGARVVLAEAFALQAADVGREALGAPGVGG